MRKRGRSSTDSCFFSFFRLDNGLIARADVPVHQGPLSVRVSPAADALVSRR